MSSISLSILGVVFVAWLLGVAVVLAVLREDLEGPPRAEEQREPDLEPYR